MDSQKHTGPGVRAEALTIPELEQSKAAVLNTLASVHSRRSYTFAINRFIAWYCSEPRLTFNRAVVVRYRSHLESLRLSASTINLHLSAIRRLADESSESGWLTPELAIGWPFPPFFALHGIGYQEVFDLEFLKRDTGVFRAYNRITLPVGERLVDHIVGLPARVPIRDKLPTSRPYVPLTVAFLAPSRRNVVDSQLSTPYSPPSTRGRAKGESMWKSTSD